MNVDLETISSFPPEIRNNNSGTSAFPLFVGCCPGPIGSGRNFIFKIRAKYFATTVYHHSSKQTLNIQCRKHRYGCKFKASLKILKVFDKKSPGFYDTDNFTVIPIRTEDHAQFCMGFEPHQGF